MPVEREGRPLDEDDDERLPDVTAAVAEATLRDWATDRATADWHGRGAPVVEALDLATQLVGILNPLHQQGLVALDFTPDNLMVNDDGRIRLIDRKHAIRTQSHTRPIASGYAAPEQFARGYAAPEQITKGHPVSEQTTASHVVPEQVAKGHPAPEPFDRGNIALEPSSLSSDDPVVTRKANLFGLGATLVYLTSAIDPFLIADAPTVRSGEQRLDLLIRHAGGQMPALQRLSPLIRGLMQDDPDQRWDLSRACAFLTTVRIAVNAEAQSASRARVSGWSTTCSRAPFGSARPAQDPPPPDVLPDTTTDQLLADGLKYLARTMDLNSQRLWPAGEFEHIADACNVQHGAAGVLGVLTRAADVLGGAQLRRCVADVAGWMERQLHDTPRIHRSRPGLYFGGSGTAWALHDAARFLGDQHIADQALERAKQVPVWWPNPGVGHGTAGIGLAQWQLWHSSGDLEFALRAVDAAETVLLAGQEHGDRLLWPIPATCEPHLAGRAPYGFTHGVAGVGTFLLYSWLATGNRPYLEAALRAGETLRHVAEFCDDAAWWRSGEDDETDHRMHLAYRAESRQTGQAHRRMSREPAGEPGQIHRRPRNRDALGPRPADGRLGHLCSGSSGIGTFLIRLWSATAEGCYRDLAEAAAIAIHRDRWYSSTSACHGLAGDGEFLLDLADLTGVQQYRDWAGEVAGVMHAHHAIRDGLMVLPDGTGTALTAGYSTGQAGALGFLLRLRHGGSRWWMPDFLLPATSRPGTGPGVLTGACAVPGVGFGPGASPCIPAARP